ncbi:MAG: ribosomal protein S18-alanine N-acetyltransferase [Gammaproteobacteria bacterium]|nr:ribosomal protein S18-alanine N-acetyltransferase [Gammaproteobacteria bacterium]
MREIDVEAIIEIEHSAYDFPWTPGIFHDCLRVGYSCWVLGQHNPVDSYGIMTVGAGECHILNVCVRPLLQNTGLGRFMMEHLLDLAGEYRADTAFLEVRPTNQSAIHLYESMGFNRVGVRRGYYPSAQGREDALILAKTLVA